MKLKKNTFVNNSHAKSCSCKLRNVDLLLHSPQSCTVMTTQCRLQSFTYAKSAFVWFPKYPTYVNHGSSQRLKRNESTQCTYWSGSKITQNKC